jgi:oxygen-independent coproporphyrinogen-3 oxidase
MRAVLARQLGPFRFKAAPGFLPDYDVPHLGLYVHIPFCEEVCPFCPYYKVKYSPERKAPYLRALASEIDEVGSRLSGAGGKRGATSLYFGGGSPALMLDELASVRAAIDRRFSVEGHAGVELHPRDVKDDTAAKLNDAGFDMVSVGIQSFNDRLLAQLGRSPEDTDRLFARLSAGRFDAIDVDLIFGIPDERPEDLRADFIRAVESGATQISTYPFIDFSYAKNRRKPQGRKGQKALLETLLATAAETGFARTSVWTFGRKDAPRYSSITRDCFVGFGPSATSLGRDSFKVNTFSVDAYVQAVDEGRIPTALEMRFKDRTRKLYWLFWNCYNGALHEDEYRALFRAELGRDFRAWLGLGKAAKLLERTERGWKLTDSGSYHFHWIEQEYTHQYIDKTWRLSMERPWPEGIALY